MVAVNEYPDSLMPSPERDNSQNREGVLWEQVIFRFVNSHAGEKIAEKVRNQYYSIVESREIKDKVTAIHVLAERVSKIEKHMKKRSF